MLSELRVRDLGVIADLSLTLGPGMTAITGETGAGKTLLVEAIELLTGGRADSVLVRPGATEAVVEGRFDVGDDERIVCRVVPASGRSRAYIDARMAPVSALAEMTEQLVDLHGQHAHQSLLRAAGQRDALDAFAGVDLGPVRAARRRLSEADNSLASLGGDARARAREIELLRFQLSDIDGADVADTGEEARLAAEEDLLAEASAHRAAATAAHTALSGDGGALDLLGRAIAVVAGRAPLAAASARLDGLAAEAADVASELRNLADSLTDDPERLDEVRARRQLLRDLCRRYGDTLGDVLSYRAEADARLSELSGHAESVARLEAEREAALHELASAQAAVGRARRRAAPTLATAVEERLRALAMPAARLNVEVGADGAGDEVVFLIAANPGAPPLPLAKVASGGELARTMLAARLVLSVGPPVLVFDEVDAGIGGEAAVAVGRALADLGRTHQVLVVTHLPQVAAFADRQVAVRKDVDGDDTRTTVEALDDAGRVVELSRMLSGRPDSGTARGHAEELLAAARGRPSRRAAGRQPSRRRS